MLWQLTRFNINLCFQTLSVLAKYTKKNTMLGKIFFKASAAANALNCAPWPKSQLS